MAIVRTSDSTGYYIDIYRSANPENNEYLYHNIGNQVTLLNGARKPLVLRADPVIVVMKGLGGSSHGSKNILCGGWSDFRAGGATPSLADLHGLASRDR